MGLGEAWSVSTSGAEQDRTPATHQPQCYCPASQRPTPGARQWRRCSKLSQEWGGLTKIVHLALQPFLPPPSASTTSSNSFSRHHREPEKETIIKKEAEGMSFSFFSCSLTHSFKSKFPFFWGRVWGPVGGQLFCLPPLADLHLHSFSIKVAIVSSDLWKLQRTLGAFLPLTD